MADRPTLDRQVQGLDSGEAAFALGPAHRPHQIFEGGIGSREVFEVDARVEHHPVQVRLLECVPEIRRDECGQVPDRIVRERHGRKPGFQPGEALLPEGHPQPVHAAEVGVDGHRGDAGARHECTQSDRFTGTEHVGRPFEKQCAHRRIFGPHHA